MSDARRAENRRTLNTNELLRQAIDIAGVSDYGDERVARKLETLVACITSDVNFSVAGLCKFREQIMRILVNRLRFHEDLKRNPQILDEDVSDPIVIFGLPRSGTTKTQRMMAASPNVLKPYLWQMLNPAPYPNALPGRADPRIAAAHTTDHLSEESSEIQAAHEMTGDAVEEDWILFEQTLNDFYFFIFSPSQALADRMLATTADDHDNYAYVRTLFQYLQWQNGGKRGRPWIMKNNSHLGHLDALLEFFPKATLLHLHRDPKISIPSWAKLQTGIYNTRVDDVDLKFVGRACLSWAQTTLCRYVEARDRLHLDSRIIDVAYETIRDQPMSIVRDAFLRSGHAMSATDEQACLAWHAANEQHRLGKHEYSLEEFGLTSGQIDHALRDYIERFIKSGNEGFRV